MSREVQESPKQQGPDEKLHYIFDFTPWGITAPTDPVVQMLDAKTLADVSSTVLSGTATVSGAQVTTPLVQSLTAKQRYILTCQVSQGDEVAEAYCSIIADSY